MTASSWHLACLDLKVFSDIPDTSSPTFIDLSHNAFSSLSSFPSLPSLQELNLSSNRLTSLPPAEFPVLENLRVLDLSFNHLSSFSGLSLAKNLEVLSLRGNRLAHLKDMQILYFSGLTKLVNLDISLNHIVDVRQVLFLTKFARIKNLATAGNPFTRSPQFKLAILQSIDSLEILDGESVTEADRYQAKVTPMVLTSRSDSIRSCDIETLGHFVVEQAIPDREPVIPESQKPAELSPAINEEIKTALLSLREAAENQELVLMRKISEQDREISDLHVTISGLRKDREKIAAVNKKLSEDNSKFRAGFEMFEHAITDKENKAHEKIGTLQGMLDRLMTDHGELNRTLAEVAVERDLLRSELASFKGNFSDQGLKMEEALKSAAELAVLLERKTQELARVQADSKTQVEKLKSELEQLRKDAINREEFLNHKLTETLQTSDTTAAGLNLELSRVVDERDRLLGDNLRLSESAKSTSDALKAALEENLTLADSNKTLNAMIHAMQKKLDKLHAQQGLLERACKDELNTMSKRLKAAEVVTKESKELADFNCKQLELVKSENSRISDQLKDRLSDLTASESARRRAVAELAAQTEQLAKLRKSETDLLADLSSARTAAQIAEERARKSHEELSELRGTFGLIECELDEYKARSEAEILGLKKERDKSALIAANRDALVEDLRRQIDDKISECAKLESEKSIIAEKLKTSESTIAYVHEEVEDMRQDFLRQRAEISDRDAEIEKLAATLQEQKTKIADLETSVASLEDVKRTLHTEVKQRDEEMKILLVAMEKEKRAADEKIRKVKELFAISN